MRDSDPQIVLASKSAKSRARGAARKRDSSPRLLEARAHAPSKPGEQLFLVKLELENEQIADIYKQGLAERAEVWRQGAWRPLVTTQELRGMLHAPRRPKSSQRKSSPRSAPPPPPVGAPSIGVQLAELARRYQDPIIREKATPAELDAISDFEDTHVRNASPEPTRTPAIQIVPAVSAPTPTPTPRRKPHSIGTRYLELALAALASMLLTLSTLRALELHRAGVFSSLHAAQPAPSTAPSAATAPVGVLAAAPKIPIVKLADLPIFWVASSFGAARTGPSLASSAATPSSHAAPARAFSGSAQGFATPAPRALASGPDRAALSQALARAARSARSCGEGPETAQVVLSYAPSGVPRSVRFGSAAPSRSLRGCVLGAMARAVIPPFAGEPVTVEKTLRW